jgi:BolA-like protein 3
MFLKGGCGSFYAISITSSAFKGLPMIKQHRLVNDTLKKEIEGIHGLQVCYNSIETF